MVVKSIIAGTVMSLMAGGVVYFGTEVDASTMKENFVEKTSELKAEISDKVMVGGRDDHPHSKKPETDVSDTGETESSSDIPSVKTESGKVIEAKKPTLSHAASSSKHTDSEPVKTADADKPQKKWLDQYLTSEDEDARTDEALETENNAAPEKKTGIARGLLESMGLAKDRASKSDTGTFIVEDDSVSLTEEDIEAAEAAGFEERVMETENIWVEDNGESNPAERKRIVIKDVVRNDDAIIISDGPDGTTKTLDVEVIHNEDGKTTIETQTIDMGDGKTMKIVKKTVISEKGMSEDDNAMRVRVFTDEEGNGGLSAEDVKGMHESENVSIHKLLKDAKTKNISGTVKIVMTQAAKIEMPELRDRAYLDIVSYGLEYSDYEVASRAMKEIEQVELRDTARNRIAIAHAKDGDAEDAFKILDDLEVDALRDVMRLQVIEAMIAPEQLPQDMQ